MWEVSPKSIRPVESSKPKSSSTSLIGPAGAARLDVSIAGKRELSFVDPLGKSRLDCSTFLSPKGNKSSLTSLLRAPFWRWEKFYIILPATAATDLSVAFRGESCSNSLNKFSSSSLLDLSSFFFWVFYRTSVCWGPCSSLVFYNIL